MKNETFTLEALIELMTHQQELLSEKDKTITYLQEQYLSQKSNKTSME
jgi:hypothetical protein